MKKFNMNKVDMLDVWYPTFPNDNLVELKMSDDFAVRFKKNQDEHEALQKEIEDALNAQVKNWRTLR
jgi:hypothetical protein